MNEMIERVARAICLARGENPNTEDIVSFPSVITRSSEGQLGATIMLSRNAGAHWKRYTGEARAAIEAMREPSDEMLDAGYDASHPIDGAIAYGLIALIWSAMNGAALHDQEKTNE